MKPRAAFDRIRFLCSKQRRSALAAQINATLDQVKWDDEDSPVLGDVGEFEERVRKEIATIAPPGTAYTPELAEKVRTHMTKFVSDELTRVGFPTAFAALIAASIKIKKAD